MKYEYAGRSLYLSRSGPDVRILHDVSIYLGCNIPPDVYSNTNFGQNTKNAVTDIQKKYGHPGTYGAVDQPTVKLINTALDAKQPEHFVVLGSVRYKNGPVAQGLAIRAYDVDHGNEKKLGKEVLNGDDGRYLIDFSVDQLIKPDRKSPNLLVRAFRLGKEVAH